MSNNMQLARGFPRAVDIGNIWPRVATAEDRLGWRETTSVVPWSRPSGGITGDLDRSTHGPIAYELGGGLA